MMRVAPVVGLVALLGVTLAGQSTSTVERFEVADVRPSAETAGGRPAALAAVRIGVPRNGRYEIRRASMVDLIRTAWGVEADKVVGGPHWLEMDRFDVIAKVPPTATRETVKPMLRALLADRFGLVLKEEIKPVASNAIVRSVGELRLKEAPAGAATTCPQNIQTSTTGGQMRLIVTMACRGMTLATLAEQLTRAPAIAGVTGPVVDATGLAGAWDFDLRFSPAQLVSLTGSAAASGPSFAAALAQLGLKFEPRQVPMPLLTVERVSQVPTPNDAAAVAAAFPPGPPPEFEVVDVRPAAPGAPTRLQIMPNGSVNVSAPLRMVLSLAWELPSTDGSIVSTASLDRPFELIAKMTTSGPAEQVDREVVGQMIQKALADQIGLKSRWEERQVKGYSLVADGAHKLVKADPTSRTRCAASSRAAGNSLEQTLVCQNMTMAEFAARLQQYGGAMFPVPVLDETKIEGRWNFTVAFAPPALAQALAQARALQAPNAAGAGPGASDPTGVMTLEEAVDRQMGLKLRARQRQGRVLVVDYDESALPAASDRPSAPVGPTVIQRIF